MSAITVPTRRARMLVVGASLLGAPGCMQPLPSSIDGAFSSGAGGEGAEDPGNADPATGLPCDVAEVLAARCDACHAAPANIPPLLVTRDDLAAPSSDPATTMAEASVLRMRDAARPMPPAGVPPSGAVAVFEAWIAAGLPGGDCGASGDQPSPYDTPAVCTSDLDWTGGDSGGDKMYPGRPCNDCHARQEAKIFGFAGTVYPTAHEPDDCYGVGDGAAVVELVDAQGRVLSASTKETGNFSRSGTIAFPATVRVLAGSAVLVMATPIASAADGDCNRCHDQSGIEGAPGRIIMPP